MDENYIILMFGSSEPMSQLRMQISKGATHVVIIIKTSKQPTNLLILSFGK